ncbi:MAG: FAD-dependent thymidylate synthase [Spirochaetales bacterium]|nr:FAD-dependent thymidylate synthase [Spirochaetales bacterium]
MEKQLHVELMKYTPVPIEIIATAARLCYSASDIHQLLENMSGEKGEKLLVKLMEMGHESPLEHAVFTFGIEGISRACTHQLVRHRIASYSQQSQRYVEEKEFDYIIPPSIAGDKELKQKYITTMEELGNLYKDMGSKIPIEDARYILPNGCETKIIVTMNARSLKNFFMRRVCLRAQWEIRRMAIEMLRLCKAASPLLFKNMGAPCTSTKICPEGAMSCGKWKAIPGAKIMYKGEILSKEEIEDKDK